MESPPFFTQKKGGVAISWRRGDPDAWIRGSNSLLLGGEKKCPSTLRRVLLKSPAEEKKKKNEKRCPIRARGKREEKGELIKVHQWGK